MYVFFIIDLEVYLDFFISMENTIKTFSAKVEYENFKFVDQVGACSIWLLLKQTKK